MKKAETPNVDLQGHKGQSVPEALYRQAVKVPVQGNPVITVNKCIDGVLEEHRIVVLKGSGFNPYVMEGN